MVKGFSTRFSTAQWKIHNAPECRRLDALAELPDAFSPRSQRRRYRKLLSNRTNEVILSYYIARVKTQGSVRQSGST
ncbi:Uncharacterized protein HZ326_24759 [Fusarium oxysporum f. sp. albedinis]|nr:Uncharacterized protein HZ326_24759 [Fusarium oxysporum f. sp. albedinis]